MFKEKSILHPFYGPNIEFSPQTIPWTLSFLHASEVCGWMICRWNGEIWSFIYRSHKYVCANVQIVRSYYDLRKWNGTKSLKSKTYWNDKHVFAVECQMLSWGTESDAGNVSKEKIMGMKNISIETATSVAYSLELDTNRNIFTNVSGLAPNQRSSWF